MGLKYLIERFLGKSECMTIDELAQLEARAFDDFNRSVQEFRSSYPELLLDHKLNQHLNKANGQATIIHHPNEHFDLF